MKSLLLILIAGTANALSVKGIPSNVITSSITVPPLYVSGGNVGVGTSSPGTKLHVSSGILTVDGTGAKIKTLVGASVNTASPRLHLFSEDYTMGMSTTTSSGTTVFSTATISTNTLSANTACVYFECVVANAANTNSKSLKITWSATKGNSGTALLNTNQNGNANMVKGFGKVCRTGSNAQSYEATSLSGNATTPVTTNFGNTTLTDSNDNYISCMCNAAAGDCSFRSFNVWYDPAP